MDSFTLSRTKEHTSQEQGAIQRRIRIVRIGANRASTTAGVGNPSIMESNAQTGHCRPSCSCKWGRSKQKAQTSARNTQRQPISCLLFVCFFIVCTFFGFGISNISDDRSDRRSYARHSCDLPRGCGRDGCTVHWGYMPAHP